MPTEIKHVNINLHIPSGISLILKKKKEDAKLFQISLFLFCEPRHLLYFQKLNVVSTNLIYP